jgi:catechol 2,3-dioxygenase-like lactoylglutathione lyase family enzyme
MFEATRAFSGFSVDDIAAARRFYGETLGLRVTDLEGGLLRIHLGGEVPVLVYPKGDQHRPASFTILNFPVDDVDAAVDALAEKGLRPERYPGMPQDDKGVMRDNGPTIAWYTDPAGNVLSVIEA